MTTNNRAWSFSSDLNTSDSVDSPNFVMMDSDCPLPSPRLTEFLEIFSVAFRLCSLGSDSIPALKILELFESMENQLNESLLTVEQKADLESYATDTVLLEQNEVLELLKRLVPERFSTNIKNESDFGSHLEALYAESNNIFNKTSSTQIEYSPNILKISPLLGNRPRTTPILTKKISKVHLSNSADTLSSGLSSSVPAGTENIVYVDYIDGEVNSDKKINFLVRRLSAAESKLTETKTESEEKIFSLQNKIEELKLEVGKKNREVSTAKSHEKSLENAVDQMEASILALNKELGLVKSKYTELTSRFLESIETISDMESNLDLYEKELQDCIDFNQKYASQYEVYLADLTRISEKALTAEFGLRQMKDRNISLERENLQLKKRIAESEEKERKLQEKKWK
ncbi:hypothetical protein HK096_009922, partial [Nowakowskiella sp. JEL0078]